ncbi:hypothetical protein SCP_0900650 [Sparassis crispa]|uniref:C2H2-type domain-containing protein n=1 Tax=Sparassis crispa TaxID=139825 RepID=A0A401GVD3_9APHY|nr:hypothetical protein SCP_0900650 [Sparassis crispa]GBE86187.1 hypothetical protein SCP_0900650 [Sparassis crispa]
MFPTQAQHESWQDESPPPAFLRPVDLCSVDGCRDWADVRSDVNGMGCPVCRYHCYTNPQGIPSVSTASCTSPVWSSQVLHERHDDLRPPEPSAPVLCTKCTYSATDRLGIEDHMREKHGDMAFRCPYVLTTTGESARCEFTTDDYMGLRHHLLLSHGQLVRDYGGKSSLQDAARWRRRVAERTPIPPELSLTQPKRSRAHEKLEHRSVRRQHPYASPSQARLPGPGPPRKHLKVEPPWIPDALWSAPTTLWREPVRAAAKQPPPKSEHRGDLALFSTSLERGRSVDTSPSQ